MAWEVPNLKRLGTVQTQIKMVVIAVWDRRPEVVSGDRKETFVGVRRSLYGIPSPVHTVTKRTLAGDLAATAEGRLRRMGAAVTRVEVSPFVTQGDALASLAATGASRLLLIEVRDWMSDTMVNETLRYDVELRIYDQAGKLLGLVSNKGEDEIGPRKRPERVSLPKASADVIVTLLISREAQAAYSPTAEPIQPPAKCTADQILKMKEAGLSEEQIKAACGAT